MNPGAFRRALLSWYDRHRRDLPWRASTDFYRVWISEIMLQQTRVEAVIPYFHRFLDRFPDAPALAAASEPDVLAAWSGLGYYSRARNLRAAAQRIAVSGAPACYDRIIELPGVGPYTAAAISSIALGLPHAAVDGNVLRVISRLTNDASDISRPRVKTRIAAEAARLLDPKRPGDFNQAMMELGATVCIPRAPLCGKCPVERHCEARIAGRERQLPVKRGKPAATEIELYLAAHFDGGRVLLVRRPETEKRLAGFWELPVDAEPRQSEFTWTFTHRIVNDLFRVTVRKKRRAASGHPGEYFASAALGSVPVTTITRKALKLISWGNRRKSVPAVIPARRKDE